MELNWNFLGGGGVQNKKNLPWGEYGYFLELYIKRMRVYVRVIQRVLNQSV